MPLSVTAALSLLLTAADPSPSAAEPPSENPSPQATQSPGAAREPAWSIGAGLTFGQGGLSSLSSLTGLTTLAPGVSAFVEHQRGPRSFLVLDLSAAYQSSQYGSGSTGHVRRRSVSADIGFRYLLTAPDAVVDVSVLALVNGGLSDSVSTVSGSLSSQVLGLTQWNLGVSGGFVVERKLVPGLFVRISTPVLYASYDRGKADYADLNTVTTSGFGVGLRLAPRLELRLTF
jgi:hypothetical protein